MASITIHNLDQTTMARLQAEATQHGRSAADEAGEILRQSLAAVEPAPPDLAAAIRRRFAALGGVDLDLPARDPMPAPPHLGS